MKVRIGIYVCAAFVLYCDESLRFDPCYFDASLITKLFYYMDKYVDN